MPKGGSVDQRRFPVFLVLLFTTAVLAFLVHQVFALQASVARLSASLDQLSEALAAGPRSGSMLSLGRGSPVLSDYWEVPSPPQPPTPQSAVLRDDLLSLDMSRYRRPKVPGSSLDWGKELYDVHRRRFGDGLRRPTRYHDDDFDSRDWYMPPADVDLGGDLWLSEPRSSYSSWGSAYSSAESTGRDLRKRLVAANANRTAHFEATLRCLAGSAPAGNQELPCPEVPQPEWRIPRVLHQTWKTDKVPAKFARHLASWRRLHPGWRFEFWDDHTSRELIAERFPKHLRQYDRMSGIKRADVARLAALATVGGVYADIDVEAAQSLEPLLQAAEASSSAVLLGEENFVHAVLLERKAETLVSNAVMIGSPGHPFWEEVLQEIFSKTWCGEDPVQCTGPRIVDRVNWEHLRRTPGCRQKGCVLRLPYDYFSPNIARWNAGNMAKECRQRSAPQSTSRFSWLDDTPYSPTRLSDELVHEACRSLDRALASPTALHSGRT